MAPLFRVHTREATAPPNVRSGMTTTLTQRLTSCWQGQTAFPLASAEAIHTSSRQESILMTIEFRPIQCTAAMSASSREDPIGRLKQDLASIAPTRVVWTDFLIKRTPTIQTRQTLLTAGDFLISIRLLGSAD